MAPLDPAKFEPFDPFEESDPPADAADERDLLAAALRDAAPLALRHFRPSEPCSARDWRKEDGSSVTEADMAVNEALKAFLLSRRPDYGWLSEEEAHEEDPADRLARRRVLILDPIDGTRSFMEGSDAFCLSLALVEDGAPIAAAVLAPAMERMFDASLGGGARVNGAALPSARPEPADPPAAMAPSRDLKQERWAGAAPTVSRRYLQPLAHRLCAVAAGDADGLITLKSTHEWDIAAAALIAVEAGLTVTDRAGRAPVYNKRVPVVQGLLAAPPGLHRDWMSRRPIG